MMLKCIGGPCAGQIAETHGRAFRGDSVDVRKYVESRVPVVKTDDTPCLDHCDRLYRYRIEQFTFNQDHVLILVYHEMKMVDAFNDLVRRYVP